MLIEDNSITANILQHWRKWSIWRIRHHYTALVSYYQHLKMLNAELSETMTKCIFVTLSCLQNEAEAQQLASELSDDARPGTAFSQLNLENSKQQNLLSRRMKRISQC